MVRIGYAVHVHRSARKLHLGLDSLSMPPGQDIEGHFRVFLNVHGQSTSNQIAATITFLPGRVLLLALPKETETIQNDVAFISTITAGIRRSTSGPTQARR